MTPESDVDLAPELVQALLLSQDAAAQLESTVYVRKRLSVKSSGTIAELIKHGLVPRFVHFLEETRHPELQLEAAKVLAKVASEQIQVVIKAPGVVASLIKLLSSPNLDIAEQAVLTLGSIAADSPQVLIDEKALPILRQLLFHEKVSIVKEACLAVGHILHGTHEQTPAVLEANLIPALLDLFTHQDGNVRREAVEGISKVAFFCVHWRNSLYLKMEYLIGLGAIPSLCDRLTDPDSAVIHAALIGLSNILLDDSGIVNATVVSQYSVFDKIKKFLTHNDLKIRERALNTIRWSFKLFVPEMLKALSSTVMSTQLEVTRMIRQTISTQKSTQLKVTQMIHQPFITPSCDSDPIIEAGFVPRFVTFLEASDFPELQLEAAKVLAGVATDTNSSYGSQVVTQAGAVAPLLRLVSSPDNRVAEQSILTLGSIAAYSPESRNVLLNSNLLSLLLGLISDNPSTSMVRAVTETISNLCHRTEPLPNFAQLSPCLPQGRDDHLSRLINAEDTDTVCNVCTALSNLCKGPPQQWRTILNAGVCPRAVQLLDHSSSDVVSAALDLLCSIAQGGAAPRQALIEENISQALCRFLMNPVRMEKFSTPECRLLTYLTAGSESQIRALIDEAPLLSALLQLRYTESFCALSVIVNVARTQSEPLIVALAQAGAIPFLCRALTVSQSIGPWHGERQLDALTSLEEILLTGQAIAQTSGSSVNEYATQVEQCDGLSKITALSQCDNLAIQEKASRLLRRYFSQDPAVIDVLTDEDAPLTGDLQ